MIFQIFPSFLVIPLGSTQALPRGFRWSWTGFVFNGWLSGSETHRVLGFAGVCKNGWSNRMRASLWSLWAEGPHNGRWWSLYDHYIIWWSLKKGRIMGKNRELYWEIITKSSDTWHRIDGQGNKNVDVTNSRAGKQLWSFFFDAWSKVPKCGWF